jgi:hypothetical protein
MNAIELSPVVPAPPQADDLPMTHGAPANDDGPTPDAGTFGPETVLAVRFIGISRREAERALASFPGARRCVILAES